MTPRSESDLAEQAARSRAELIRRGTSLATSIRSAADPFGPVRRDPVGSVVTCLAVGMIAGALTSGGIGGPSRDATGRKNGSTGASGLRLAMRLLPALVPLLAKLRGGAVVAPGAEGAPAGPLETLGALFTPGGDGGGTAP